MYFMKILKFYENLEFFWDFEILKFWKFENFEKKFEILWNFGKFWNRVCDIKYINDVFFKTRGLFSVISHRRARRDDWETSSSFKKTSLII